MYNPGSTSLSAKAVWNCAFSMENSFGHSNLQHYQKPIEVIELKGVVLRSEQSIQIHSNRSFESKRFFGIFIVPIVLFNEKYII